MSIRLTDVSKRFGGLPAVSDVTLDIPTGEFVAVLGPSGCGKTTLLRLIAGLETLDSGSIAVAGRTVADRDRHLPPEDRNVGVVFQSYALWPHMSVLDNVAFPQQAGGQAADLARRDAMEKLRTVELEALAGRKPAELSGGQRQRVALARCLAQGAATVLMDEPLANLDPHLRTAMEEELTAFHARSGATILYITHDQREAMALAGKIAVMFDGHLVQTGSPEEIFREPATEQVARFIGRGSLLDADCLGISDGEALLRIAGSEFAVRRPKADGTPTPGPVRVMIRPEDIAVTEHGTGNCIRGSIARITYRGGAWEAVVTFGAGKETLLVILPEHAEPGSTLSLRLRDAWIIGEAEDRSTDLNRATG